MKINGLINWYPVFLLMFLNCKTNKINDSDIKIYDNINLHAFKLFEKNRNCLEVIKNLELNKDLFDYNTNTIDQYYETLLAYSCFCNDSLRYNMYNKLRTNIKIDTTSYEVNKYINQDAESYILNNAKDIDILLFNEQHHTFEQRIFLKKILKGLKQNGFNFLAIEALDNTKNIDFIEEFEYDSGFYTKESNFSNLINEALNLGFYVIPFEENIECESNKCRDSIQALNIYNKTVMKDMKSKTIVLSGGSHIYKAKNKMAFYLSRLTEKKILSIDMMSFNKSITKNNNSFYDQINKFFKLNKPSIILLNEIPFRNNKFIDYNVFFPYKENHEWQNLYNKFNIKLNLKTYNGMLFRIYERQAYKKSNIPIFQQIIRTKEIPLFLEKGTYIYEIVNEKNKLLTFKEIKI